MNQYLKITKILALSMSLFSGYSALAQEVPVGRVDGHLIVSGTKSVTKEDLAITVEQDLRSQGVDLMNPKSGKYYLRFGGTVIRIIVYFNAEKGRIRWEMNNDLLKFTPANLPEQVLALMMKQGKLRPMTAPTNEEYAEALANELKKLGIDLVHPQAKKVCVKLGYRNCKLSLDFTESGLLQWRYKGTPFMKGNYAEAMMRILQSQKNFQAADGTDLLIFQGDNEASEPEVLEISKNGGAGPTKSTKPTPKTSSDTPITNAPSKSDKSEAVQIKLAYSLSDDHSDYSESESTSSGISVKGVKKSTGTGDNEFGNPFGDGNGPGGNGTGGNGNGIALGGNGNGNGIKTALTAGTRACNTTVGSGGHGTTTVPVNFGSKAGEVTVMFTTYSIPDQILVRCNGHTLAQTPMISGSQELKFNYRPFGVGAKANTCIVIVNGNENHGTAWEFAVSCPGAVYTGAN